MEFGNFEQIKAGADLPFKDIEVPEWNCKVRISSMTAGDRMKYETSVFEVDTGNAAGGKMKKKDFRSELVARCMVDGSNKRLFNDDQIDILSGKSANVLHRLFTEALEINGMSKEVEAKIEKK